jgi:hypothetical protein
VVNRAGCETAESEIIAGDASVRNHLTGIRLSAIIYATLDGLRPYGVPQRVD